VLDRLRVKRLDVHKLLLGIRERYPELEAHLAPERVASWEGQGAGSAEGFSNVRSGFGGTLLFVLLFFALMRGVGALMGQDDGAKGKMDPAASAEVAEFLKKAEYDVAAMHAFGNQTRMADVKAADAVFAADLRKVVGTVGSSSAMVLPVVRSMALQSGAVADFDGLVARAELRRIWLGSVLESPDQCRAIMRGDFVNTPLTLPPEAQKREQALLKQLLEAKFLSGGGRAEGGSFTVPGWLIDQTIKTSGLSADIVTAALQDPEHPQRCKLDYAMTGAMLTQPGKVPVELLRVF
jgi:hypothetical protein